MIEVIGGGDKFAHLVVRQNDVAHGMRIGQSRPVQSPRHPGSGCVCRAALPAPARRTGKRQSRLIVDGAIVPSRPSRHFFSSAGLSNATGFDSRVLVRCPRGHSAL